MRIIRAGRQWTVHWHAFRRYRSVIGTQFDAVIDEVNTLPFFTPLWAKIPKFMLIYQLARQVWWYESPFPISAVGYLLEPLYLRPYRSIPVLTISESTERDLRKLHFRGHVTRIPIGIPSVERIQVAKATEPTFLYVGRVAPSKRLEDMVKALALFRKAMGRGLLEIVGSGAQAYRESLAKTARRLGVESSVTFRGHVSPYEKQRLMTQAHALLMTSVREGWGLVVTEANACGTPAIVYDVPGLRDSVRHDETGLVVRPNPRELVKSMVRITTDAELYARLTAEATRWSGTFSFDAAAAVVAQILEGVPTADAN